MIFDNPVKMGKLPIMMMMEIMFAMNWKF